MKTDMKRNVAIGVVSSVVVGALAFCAIHRLQDCILTQQANRAKGQKIVAAFNASVTNAISQSGVAFNRMGTEVYVLEQEPATNGVAAANVTTAEGYLKLVRCPTQKTENGELVFSDASDTDFAMSQDNEIHWTTIGADGGMEDCTVDSSGRATCVPLRPQDRKALLEQITGICQQTVNKVVVSLDNK